MDAAFAIAEADRRIAGLLNIGIVTAVNGDGTARVQIGDLGSAAIPVNALRAGGTAVWWMPTVGEQVVVAAPSGDLARAVVLCSIFAGNAPSSDAAVPMIDLRGGDMVIKGGTLRIEADLQITGRVDASQDVTAGGISLQTHTHGGVETGGGSTGVPS